MLLRDQLINELSEKLQNDGVINVTSFFSTNQIDALCDHSIDAYTKYGKRKDFISVHGGKTPRNMFTVSNANIDLAGTIITDFYNDPIQCELLSKLGKEKVSCIPFDNEKYVINGLGKENDTHGWHFDDYSYALVLIIKTPPIGCGGCVEYVPNSNNTTQRADFENIDDIFRDRVVNRRWFPNKTMYLMKSLTTLHRVTPIVSDYDRLSLAMAYGNVSDNNVKSHTSVFDLYD